MVRHLFVISVLALAACGSKSPPPPVQNAAPAGPAEPVAAPAPAPKSEIEVAMARFQDLTDKMCGCSDKTCADGVQNEMTRWSEEMSKQGSEPPKPSEAEMKRMTDIGMKYADCMTRAMGATP